MQVFKVIYSSATLAPSIQQMHFYSSALAYKPLQLIFVFIITPTDSDLCPQENGWEKSFSVILNECCKPGIH